MISPTHRCTGDDGRSRHNDWLLKNCFFRTALSTGFDVAASASSRLGCNVPPTVLFETAR